MLTSQTARAVPLAGREGRSAARRAFTAVQFLSLVLLGSLCAVTPAARGVDLLSAGQNAAGQRVVLDPASGQMYIWDLSLFANMTYGQQLMQIGQLNVQGYFGSSQWHLATPLEMQPLWAEDTAVIRSTFHPSEERFDGGYEWHYWSGRYAEGSAGIHSVSETGWGNFAFGAWDYAWPQIGNVSDVGPYPEHGAWVVAPIPIPEPGAILLLVVGATLAVGLKRRAGGRL